MPGKPAMNQVRIHAHTKEHWDSFVHRNVLGPGVIHAPGGERRHQ